MGWTGGRQKGSSCEELVGVDVDVDVGVGVGVGVCVGVGVWDVMVTGQGRVGPPVNVAALARQFCLVVTIYTIEYLFC